jgi:hypothetical protein
MEVVDKIGSTRTAAGDRPIQDVRIETIEIVRA